MKATATIIALLCGSLAGCGTPTWSQAPTTNEPRKNVLIQFGNASLHPSQARVLSGGNVAWTNYSAAYGVVFLDTATAEALGCRDMRPIFAEVAGGYQSESISPSSEDVTLPCKPADGTYPYTIRLYMQAMEGADNPDSVMHGTIIVGGAAAAN